MTDARTPEQQAAVVKCRSCDWQMPKYRKSDGGERWDVTMELRIHAKSKHPGVRTRLEKMEADAMPGWIDAHRIRGRREK